MRSRPNAAPSRLVPQGTRVVLLVRQPGAAGVVREVRREPYLRPYVVECDDGQIVYASPCDIAREDDVARAPLGPPLEL
jgi:hypothetical protein